MKLPKKYLRTLLIIRIGKADAEEVAEVLSWGADPNERTKKGTPMIIKAVRGMIVEAAVVRVLLDAGADPQALDAEGFTALQRAKIRFAKFEGRPRPKLRRSPSLTPGGELRLQPYEWEHLEELKAAHPESADEIEEMWIKERRKAAERVFDTPGNLEKIIGMLEKVTGDAR